MKRLKDKKITGLKSPISDAERQGETPSQSLVGLSAPVIPSPFDTIENTRFSIESFINEYSKIETNHEKLWEMIKKYNDVFKVKLEETELRFMFTSFVGQKAGFLPALPFSELMRQEFPKARYVIEPFFEVGTVNMLSAPPNTWKSWLLFYFASHIAQGTEAFKKFASEKNKIMIVNEEDSWRAVQDRFKILNIIDPTLEIYFRIAQGAKLESKFIDNLIKEMKELNIGVVMFDSLRSIHDADENDSTTMQKILDLLKKIAREGITVIFTHHHRKKGMFEKTSSAESSRGSSAINAAISGHLSLEEEERESGLYLIIRHLKSKAGEKLNPFEIKIVKKEDKTIDFVYDGDYKDGEKKLLQTKDQIMSVLSGGGWKAVKDFQEIKAGKNIIRQSLAILKNDGLVLSMTRAEALKKGINIPLGGKGNEIFYSLNSESVENEIINQQEVDFDNF